MEHRVLGSIREKKQELLVLFEGKRDERTGPSCRAAFPGVNKKSEQQELQQVLKT